jgi:hypothetical protein
MTVQTAAWPEGVIARYLTVGGATVDVTTPDNDVASYATCDGCGERSGSSRVPADCMGGAEHARQANTDGARYWAQDHAETCRAIPKPTP